MFFILSCPFAGIGMSFPSSFSIGLAGSEPVNQILRGGKWSSMVDTSCQYPFAREGRD